MSNEMEDICRAILDAALAKIPRAEWPKGRFKPGDLVAKSKGSQWHGRVVGWYSTDLTPIGWCVESSSERGSVQIYPDAALVPWDGKRL
jgi:dihydrofolate reductase (trimethoprim resistance protein)